MKGTLFFKAVRFLVAIAVALFLPVVAHAQLRISFVGANGVPLGTFDETADDGVTFNLEALRGVSVDGVEWHIGYRATSHAANGYPAFPNSTGWFQCGSFPGTGGFTVIIDLWTTGGNSAFFGLSTEATNDLQQMEGADWEGRAPTDYSHMLVQFNSPAVGLFFGNHPVPGTGCVRYFWIPITWTSGPVQVDESTWGGVKAMYRE